MAALIPTPPHDHARPAPGVERWAPLVAGLLLALPVLLAAYPPMADLPYHEASVSILRHLGDRSMFAPGLYVVNPGHPNQLFHGLALACALVMPTALACKLVVAATVVGIPAAAARLGDHLGAARWAALIVAPLALGWLFFMGLVANLLGLALFLALLPALDRFVARPTARGAGGVAGACVVLYLAHESMLLLYAGALVVFALGQPLRSRLTALRAAPVLFAGALVAGQLLYQRALFSSGSAPAPTVFAAPFGKIVAMPTLLLGTYDTQGARFLFAFLLAAMAAQVALRVRGRRASESGAPEGFGARVHALRFEIVAAACFVAYLAAPATLMGATHVYERFLPPAFALAILATAPRASDGARAPLPRIAALLAAAAPLGSLLVSWPAFAESSRAYRDLEALLPQIDRNSAIAALASSEGAEGYAPGSLAARAVAERGGRMLYSFSESPIAPVLIRSGAQWTEAFVRVANDGAAFCPSYDPTRFRYVLVNAPQPVARSLFAAALQPEARVVGVSGAWVLFESTLAVAPVDAPDAPLPPRCRVDTLGRRIDQITRARATH